MRTPLLVLMSGLLADASGLNAQNLPTVPKFPATAQGVQSPPTEPASPRPRDPGFTSFNLNFPGGPPALLVSMITNQTRKPLNVIIPPEHADTDLPPLNLNGVTVPQLFEALEQASQKTVTYPTGSYGFAPAGGLPQMQYQSAVTSFGFKTAPAPRDDSIWYFFVKGPVEPPKLPPPSDPNQRTVCRFFQLGPYLERGIKVEDITTALETAWKMMGENTTPNFKFHRDTKLLIAVGRPDRLLLIEEVLAQLPGGSPPIDPATGLFVVPGQYNIQPPEPNEPKPAKP